MSAFLCLLDRSGGLVDPGELGVLAEALAGYGSGFASYCRDSVGIGIRHRFTDDAARRRCGPLVEPATGRVVAVAGRPRLLDEVRGTRSDDVGAAESRRRHEGAALVLEQAARGQAFLHEVTGPFVLIEADPTRRSTRITRDHLGSLKVYYYLDSRWLIAASEPAPILRHGAVSDERDDASIARFLALRFGHTERSFFRQVRELPPAHFLEVSPTGVRVEPYWRFRRRSSARSRSAEEIREAFLGHLRRAVESDVADLEPEQVAVSLSGGLDSTAVAALAPRGVHTFSWTLEESPEGDERASVEAVVRWLSLRHEWVRGDGHYPLAGDFVDRFVGESSPYVNAFAGLKAALYSTARARGCERVLVGDGGDTLYAAREYWLRDALATGRPWAIVSLLRTIQGAVRDENGLARGALARLLLVRNLRNKMRGDHVPWLTKMARSAVPRGANAPILPLGRGAARYELSVGAKHVELESEERRLFDLCGVGRGNPFWSWPLLEMAIQLPAYWYHRDGRNKVLSREALRGLLPKEVLESPRIGLLGTFFLRGIELRRDDLRQTVFRHPHSDWQRFVRREWLEPFLENTGAIAFGHTILWRVICYELWTRRLVGAVW